MAREKQLVRELNQNYVPDVPILHTNAYDATKEVFLKCLREAFAGHPEFTYVPDPERGWDFPDIEKSKITIFEEYPYETLKLPAIMVSISGMRDYPMSFNQDLLKISYQFDDAGNQVFDAQGRPIPIYYEYAGAWEATFNVTVNAESPIDRDLLVDYVKIHIMHVYRDWLYTRGVHVRTLSSGGEETREWKNDFIYTVNIACEIYTEWTNRIPIRGPILDRLGIRIGSPISSHALVPQGVVKEGEGYNYKGDFVIRPSITSDVTTIDFDLDLRPESAMDTVEFNQTSQQYEITAEWLEFIARWFNAQELANRYNITQISQLTINNWFDMLAVLSSPARMGYPTLDAQLEAEIAEIAAELGLDPTGTYVVDGYGYGYGYGDGYGGLLNQLIILQQLRAALQAAYITDVTRYQVGSPYPTNP